MYEWGRRAFPVGERPREAEFNGQRSEVDQHGQAGDDHLG